MTIRGSTNYPDFDDVQSDDGEEGFGDRATSVRWSIPEDWALVLYEDSNYRGRAYPLVGTGDDPNLGDFGDEACSARWEARP